MVFSVKNCEGRELGNKTIYTGSRSSKKGTIKNNEYGMNLNKSYTILLYLMYSTSE